MAGTGTFIDTCFVIFNVDNTNKKEMSIRKTSDDNEVLVGRLLEEICDITLKIKRELDVINNLVKDNGEFSLAVAETNQTLIKIIKNNDISIGESESESYNDDNDKKKNRSHVSRNK